MAEDGHPTLSALSLRYGGVLILTSLALVLIVWLVEYFWNIEAPGTALSMVTIIVPAMDAGQVFAQSL